MGLSMIKEHVFTRCICICVDTLILHVGNAPPKNDVMCFENVYKQHARLLCIAGDKFCAFCTFAFLAPAKPDWGFRSRPTTFQNQEISLKSHFISFLDENNFRNEMGWVILASNKNSEKIQVRLRIASSHYAKQCLAIFQSIARLPFCLRD